MSMLSPTDNKVTNKRSWMSLAELSNLLEEQINSLDLPILAMSTHLLLKLSQCMCLQKQTFLQVAAQQTLERKKQE